MSEKIFNSRIIHKHDTEAHWRLAVNFIPKKAEIIVYDRDNNYNYERFKIGDGVSNVNDLPFVNDSLATEEYVNTKVSEIEIPSIDGLATEEYVNNLLYGKPSEGLKYALNDDGISYKVQGIGTCTDIDIIIPRIYNDKPVTTIHDWAFTSCSSLTSVVLPNSVTTIGNRAFTSCSSLTSVVIPDSVTTIGDYAFQSCSSLTSVVIGDSVTTIGNSAFTSCSSLTSVVIPDSVTTIGNREFYGCSSLTSVVIGNSVTSIGEYAFYGCSNLTSVVIPDGVASIGRSAFHSCSSLTSVVIGNSVTTIGNHAFYGCSNLTSVVIPDSVTTIGASAFYGCSNLTSVVIPDSVTSIGDTTFYPNTIHLYCEAESKPEGWDERWNKYSCPVTWGFAGNFISVNEKIDSIEMPSIEGLATTEYVDTKVSKLDELAHVATSGRIEDLTIDEGTVLVFDAGMSGFDVEVNAAGGTTIRFNKQNETLTAEDNEAGGQTGFVNRGGN